MTVERPRLGDLFAGLSVALVLVPQGLAYAELAGMPPQLGLLAGTLPPIVAALFVSSPYLQTGPTALTALLIVGSLTPLAVPGSVEYVALGALLALTVGVFRVIFGLARLGIAAYFVSQPVLTGFTTGAALLIIGSQIPNVVGVDSDADRIMVRAARALSDPAEWSWAGIALAVLVLAISLGTRWIHPVFPSVLAAVAVAWAIAAVFGYGGATVGEVPQDWPIPDLDLPWGDWTSLLLPGFVIALIGFAEPSSIARTYAAADRKPWSADREFVSQGVANLVAGSTGTFPVGGSFGRSSLNRAAGAKTRWSGAITGLAVLAIIPASAALETLPTAVLGAVVIGAVISLIRFDAMFAIWRVSKPQTFAALATLVATLVLEPRIDYAIIFGLVLSVGVHLFRELDVTVDAEERDGVLYLAPKGVLWFGSINRVVEDALDELALHDQCERVEVDLRGIGRIDVTAAQELADMARDSEDDGIDWNFVGVPPHARRLFDGLIDQR